MTIDPLADSTEPHFPRRFGQYVLITPLGAGGMGRVYAALTPKGELCVVKRFGNPRARLPTHLIEQNKVRFLREAEITKALDHPSIAKTYESVHDGAHSYLVQEHISGMTIDYFMGALRDHQERFPISLATFVVARIADALVYLHDFRGLGLIHRDLTATNVMFSQSGDVKVIDFGIAKATLANDNLTQPHLVVGKPLWTAPEVREGSEPDRRTDLYALGLLFWYLLTGEDPTDHLAEETTLHLPAPSTVSPQIPPALDALVLRAVQVDPQGRFQNAAEFQAALSPFLPNGYDGTAELAALVRRNQLTSEDEFFTALVDRARPLLKPASQPAPSATVNISPPLHRHRRVRGAVAGAIFVAFAVLGLVALLVPHRSSPRSPIPLPPTLVKSNSEPAPLAAPSSPRSPDHGVEDIAPTRTAVGDSAGRPAGPDLPASKPAHAVSTRPAPPPAVPPRRPSRPAKAAPGAESSLPSLPPPDSQELLTSAMQAIASGETAKAVRLARASIEARPSADAYILIGKLLSTSDPTAARSALESALSLAPGNRQATSLLQLLNR